MPYRRVQTKRRRVIVYGSGHTLWSAISCQRQVVRGELRQTRKHLKRLRSTRGVDSITMEASKTDLLRLVAGDFVDINSAGGQG